MVCERDLASGFLELFVENLLVDDIVFYEQNAQLSGHGHSSSLLLEHLLYSFRLSFDSSCLDVETES